MEKHEFQDYYEVLGVPPDATYKQLRVAFREKSRDAVSDREYFEMVCAAWETLRDEMRRLEYDRKLRYGGAHDTPLIVGGAAPAPPTPAPPPQRTAPRQQPAPPRTGPSFAAQETSAAAGATGTAAATATVPPLGGDRTVGVTMAPCPVCRTPAVPGEEFCVECGLLVGSSTGAGLTQRPLPWLVSIADGREFALHAGENLVGREGADVMLPDRSVSRRHAKIVVDDGGDAVWVEDTGSTNGTKRNDAPVAPGEQAYLSDGETIQFGAVKMTIAIPPPDAPPMQALPTPGANEQTRMPVAAIAAPEGESGAARLIGKDGAEHILAGSEITVGRKPGNTVVLTGDPFVSGSHARIFFENDQFQVADLGSTNGTRLNGQKLFPNTPLPLADGDTIAFGKTEFVFRS